MLVECRLDCGGSRLQDGGKLFKVLAGSCIALPEDTQIGWCTITSCHFDHHIVAARHAGGYDEREQHKEGETKLHVDDLQQCWSWKGFGKALEIAQIHLRKVDVSKFQRSVAREGLLQIQPGHSEMLAIQS